MVGPPKVKRTYPVVGSNSSTSGTSNFTQNTEATSVSSFESATKPSRKFGAELACNGRVPIKTLSYSFAKDCEPPVLHVASVRIYTKDPKTGVDKDVHSHELRRQAIEEILGECLPTGAKDKVAICSKVNKEDKQPRESAYHVDHLIYPATKDRSHAFSAILGKTVELKRTKKKTRARDTTGRLVEQKEETVYYEELSTQVSPLTLTHSGDHLNMYLRYLRRVLFHGPDSSGVEFFSDHAALATASLDNIPGSQIKLRCRPRCHYNASKASPEIVLDFDLVPVLENERNGMTVAEALSASIARARWINDREVIKSLLSGLKVRYARLAQDERIGTEKEKLPSSPAGEKPVRVIRDVKLASEMSRIFVQTSDDIKSIRDIIISDHGSSTPLLKAPFADIGRKESFWVPIETLTVAGTQAIRDAGRFTIELKARASQVGAMEGLKKLATSILGESRTRYGGNASGEWQFKHLPDPSCSVSPTAGDASTRLAEAKLARQGFIYTDTAPPQRLTIIYVGHPDLWEKNQNFLKMVEGLLVSPGQKIVGFSDIRTVQISSLLDLTRQAAVMESDLMKAVFRPDKVDEDSTAILGIIDKRTMDKRRFRETQAELRSFGNRKPGAVTVCVDREDLQWQLDRSRGGEFPSAVLHKMKLMLGFPVYKVVDKTKASADMQMLKEQASKGLIVIGAHISHPDAESTDMCPSVAAVVASLDDELAIYPGSTRLLSRRSMTSRDGQYPFEITDLEGMMTERFEAWKQAREEKGQSVTPPSVWFYRSGYTEKHQHGDVYANEIKALECAYQHVFATRMQPGHNGLAYIGITKNLHQYTHAHQQSNSTISTFPSAPCSSPSNPTHQFLLLANTTSLPAASLATLTHTLNTTASQLSILVSPALPVLYARKLARRVFDYFRFFAHKDVSNMPGIARQTPFENHDTPYDGEGFARFLQQYLDNDAMKVLNEERACTGMIRDTDGRGGGGKLPWKKGLDRGMFYL